MSTLRSPSIEDPIDSPAEDAPQRDGMRGPECPPEGGSPFRSCASRTGTDLGPRFGRLPTAQRFRPRLWLRASGAEPAARLAWLALVLALRHGSGRVLDVFRTAEARARRRDERARRSARLIAAHLGRLKGAFAKAGQFASLRHDLLPPAWREPLSSLQRRVPPMSMESVREVVETELGAPLESLYSRFCELPVGAASVAQVHRARLSEGDAGATETEVAVKVQYPWLAASLRRDLGLLRGLARAVVWLRGSPSRVDWMRLFDEFASDLADELDFEREGRIAGEIAANLRDQAGIVVPRVIPHLTTRRVLTMTYHEGLELGDGEMLRLHGVEPRAVLEIVAHAYAKQVFVDGLFHADPHPGNLFLLDEPGATARPRVLFVDFGLSRHLAPELRGRLRAGILCLLQRDVDGFLAQMRALGVIAPGAEVEVRRAVTSMFERISATAPGSGVLAASGSQVLALKEEAKQLLQATPGLHLPSDLLLYAKTLSYLFALGDRIAPEVDLMKLSVPYLLRFLTQREAPETALTPAAGAPPAARPAGG